MVAGPTGRIGPETGSMETSPDTTTSSLEGGSAHAHRLARSTAVFFLHTAVSADTEPRAGARRGRGALRRVRPRLQRAAREGGEETGLAYRVDALLAHAPRP